MFLLENLQKGVKGGGGGGDKAVVLTSLLISRGAPCS